MNKILFFVIITFWVNYTAAQSFYSLDTIQKIEIFFSQSNWDYQMDTAKAGNDAYLIADSVLINGFVFVNAGVKHKGESSYDAAFIKNPLHISLDEIDATANYQGYSEIKLSNCYSDASMMREVLAYDILKNYMHCSKSNFAKVFINNSYIGLYNNTEHVGNNFIKNHFYTQDNTIIKANPTDVNAAKPDLTYQGVDSVNYYNRYELKSDKAWKHLINLCDTLNNNFSAIEKELDMDRAIWMLAFNNVLVNLDSYTGSFKQNYYLVRDNNLRFNPIIWDLNMCFGGFGLTGTSATLNLTQKQNLTPTLHQTDAAWPLINKTLNNSRYYKQYIAHMRTINNELNINAKALQLKALIDAAVYADVNKFYSNTEFDQFLDSTSSTLPICNGIAQLMDARNNFLQNASAFAVIAPTINSNSSIPIIPAFNNNLTITASVSNANYVQLGYRNAIDKKFTKLEMLDDGVHGDGAANDGVYGIQIMPKGTILQYYFYAENSDAGIFFPTRAEHEFLEKEVVTSNLNATDIALNECMSNNSNTILDQNNEYEDWIELYNNTSQTIALGESFLSDNIANPYKWQFPTDAIILPNGFYTVWADEDKFQLGTHTNFKLNDTNNFVGLVFNNGSSFTDSITTPILFPNQAYGRMPNGIGIWSFLEPTYNASNRYLLNLESFIKDNVYIYPNPSHDKLFIHSDEDVMDLQITNMQGQQIFFQEKLFTKQYIDLQNLPSGMYIIQFYKQNKLYNFTFNKIKI
jgi:spore coat protein CotH